MAVNPDRYDLIVIGGGSGGIATANRAASYGAKVLLIEKRKLGGTCVNVGCVPKKVMWNAANMAESWHFAESYGFKLMPPDHDFGQLVAARDAYVERLNGIYAKNLQRNGVDVLQGEARLAARGQVELGGQLWHSDAILIATGGRPKRPPIPGGELGISSDQFFALKRPPAQVAVVGSGYIGVELAGILAALGSKVSLYSKDSRILHHFDSTLSDALQEEMGLQNIEVVLNYRLRKVARREDGRLELDAGPGHKPRIADELIWTIGREPIVDIGLKELGVQLDDWGFVQVDEWQQSSVEGIYAVGDVTGRMPLTPVAIAAGRRLADRLFGGQKEAKLDYQNVPSVVFSHPPISSIGLSESDAIQRYGADAIRCYESKFTNMFYALSSKKSKTVMKMVSLLPDEKVVGLHAFGLGADELIQGFAVAMQMGATKKDFDRTIAVHPTAAEEMVLMR